MISISSENGTLIKVMPGLASDRARRIGFHPLFGFISETSAASRMKGRRRLGLSSDEKSWAFRFSVNTSPFLVVGDEDCAAERKSEKSWVLRTPHGSYQVQTDSQIDPLLQKILNSAEGKDRSLLASVVLSLLLMMAVFMVPQKPSETLVVQTIEPVEVRLLPEIQRAVLVPVPESIQAIPKSGKLRSAVNQNLGFIGLLGRKNLIQAIGGLPSSLSQVSPGAGAGGGGGSGGEVLMGLGEGVKRMTVGNTGMQGLGGIGTKGAGGGAGGYGNAMVSSDGGGNGLSALPLSQDIILEGGLGASVIQASIAKYISQVRACYEAGLKQEPGLTGTVTVHFVIGSQGTVKIADIGRSTLGNHGVEDCITNRVVTWKFPKPVGGVDVKVNYPFLLKPSAG